MIRVVISDPDLTLVHPNSIIAGINEGYGSDITSQIEISPDSLAACLAHAQSIGAIAVIRCYTGLEGYVSLAESFFPPILTFVPMPTNNHEEVHAPASIPAAIVVGTRGDTHAQGGYGPALEFFDGLNGGNTGAEARILGRLLKIYDQRGGGWYDARLAARHTASFGQAWSKEDGYGQINVAAALLDEGAIHCLLDVERLGFGTPDVIQLKVE